MVQMMLVFMYLLKKKTKKDWTKLTILSLGPWVLSPDIWCIPNLFWETWKQRFKKNGKRWEKYENVTQHEFCLGKTVQAEYMVFFKNTVISKIWEDLGSLCLKKNPPVSIETIQSLLQWKMSPKDTQSLRSHNSSCYKVLREWEWNWILNWT